MPVLSRDQILRHTQLPQETVAVPEWGGEVIVRAMTALQRDQYEQAVTDGGAGLNLIGARARLVAAVCVDEDGKLLFTPDDVDALGALNAVPVNRIAEAAMRLSGMDAGASDDMAKNSSAARGDASPSGSQKPSGGRTSKQD